MHRTANPVCDSANLSWVSKIKIMPIFISSTDHHLKPIGPDKTYRFILKEEEIRSFLQTYFPDDIVRYTGNMGELRPKVEVTFDYFNQ